MELEATLIACSRQNVKEEYKGKQKDIIFTFSIG